MNARETVAALADSLQAIDDAFDPASEQELLMAEATLGVTLPELFREIQKSYGRCMFSGEALISVKGAEPLSIFTIFGCKGDTGNLVMDFREHPDLQDRGLVPIADDLFNNRYVWDSTSGQVLFINYTDRKAPLLAAPTFEDFLKMIWIGPDS
ncbi:MAG: SMI1/KNR4 family protein [Burkholderiales bacterium]